MQKSILISIQPQHVFNILTGKKTLELRKSVPKDFKGWVYIYCTKSKPYLYDRLSNDYKWALNMREYKGKIPHKYELNASEYFNQFDRLNGHLIARFWLDQTEKLRVDTFHDDIVDWEVITDSFNEKEILEKTCLEIMQISYRWTHQLYVWVIKKLEVFDKPMQLSDFYKDTHYPNGESITPHICLVPDDKKETYESNQHDCLKSFEVKKAPQSWMYVYTNEQLP